MRCYSCNTRLKNREACYRSANTGEYLDMCDKCLDGLGIEVIKPQQDLDEDMEDNDHSGDDSIDLDFNVTHAQYNDNDDDYY